MGSERLLLDTVFVQALLNRRDQYHAQAQAILPRVRDAAEVWGLDCDDTHQLIREELNDPRVRLTCIGPAGEHGVKVAGVFSDRRAAAGRRWASRT